LGPTIGGGIAIPHTEGVPVIGGFGVIIDDILRHLPLFIVRNVKGEEFLGMVG